MLIFHLVLMIYGCLRYGLPIAFAPCAWENYCQNYSKKVLHKKLYNRDDTIVLLVLRVPRSKKKLNGYTTYLLTKIVQHR